MLENSNNLQKFAEPHEIRTNMRLCYELVDEYEKILREDEISKTRQDLFKAILTMRNILDSLNKEIENTLNAKEVEINKYNFLAIDVAKRKIELFTLVENMKKIIKSTN